MKQSISFYAFDRAFSDMGRENQFSYEGKRALFEWLDDFDDSCGTETELDVIALCCEFTEFEGFAEFQDNYADCPSCYIKTVEYIRDRTSYIEIPDSCAFIIHDF